MSKALLTLLFVLFPALAQAWPGVVLSVRDGDTLTVAPVDDRDCPVVIRLYGIDCPELSQPCGDDARAFTSRLVLGKTVHIVFAHNRQNHGRKIGIIHLPNGQTLQEHLVRNGFAWEDARYCKTPVCGLWRYYQAAAKAARLGLWAYESPVPPWEWRKRQHR